MWISKTFCYDITVADNELTQEEAQAKLEEELGKPVTEQDKPFLRHLFKSTFKLRRTAITTMPDGAVAKLVERFPLMKDMDYVNISLLQYVTFLQYYTLKK